MPASASKTVIAFLEHEAFDAPVERIDTANAHVFLAGDHAYKIKRPVNYSFLDFSTLEARRGALDNELRLNRRTAPDLYEAVVPIVMRDGALAIGGEGDTVEWILRMKRFPESALLSNIVRAGPLEQALLDHLARAIVDFHRRAEHIRERGAAAFVEVIDGNAEDLKRSVPEIFSANQVEALAAATRERFEAQRRLIQSRAEDGFVRHCHGDLHTANIIVLDGEPILFDCVEFNDDFAQIDLLYDLAYLVMDLTEKGDGRAAQYLLNAYNERLVSDEALALMPLFLSVRAAIRAKIEAYEDDADQAQRYLGLAWNALEPVAPKLYAFGGRSGTGKSTMAMALAADLGAMPGAIILRSDVIRKSMFGLEPTQKLPEAAYTGEISTEVYRSMAERAGTLLRAGRTVIADAVFGSVEERANIERTARDNNVPFEPVWLTADETTLEQRVRERTGDASDADVDIVRRQRAMDQQTVSWPMVETGSSVEALEAKLRERFLS